MKFANMKSPWFVALDVDSGQQARQLAKTVAPFAGGLKIGPRLILSEGPTIISELAQLAPVFVDQKYHDIPNTMEYSLRATFEAGATFATIHASCGPVALKRLATVEAELNKMRPFKILAVTVLTSLDEKSLPANWQATSVQDHVQLLARQVMESGLSGLVCSAQEVRKLRQQFPSAFLLTPGIRWGEDQRGDQARVEGPNEALQNGSSALVVGRPIYEAKDPRAAAEELSRLIQ